VLVLEEAAFIEVRALARARAPARVHAL